MSFGSELCYEDLLPLRWAQREPAGAAVPLATSLANEQVLRHLASVEEFRPEGADDDPPTVQELHRLEGKIDLVIDLLGEVLLQQRALPPRMPVRLCAERLEWECSLEAAPRPGEPVAVDVFLNPRYPRPLVLHGTVQAAEPVAEGRIRVCLPHEGLGEAVRGALEKALFRRHRRLVAHARRSGRRPS